MPKSPAYLLVTLIIVTAIESSFAQEILTNEEAGRARVHNRNDAADTIFRVHPSTTTAQTEVPIITHPLNPHIVLGSANANPVSGTFSSQRLGLYYTTDGGTNWMGKDTLPVSPARTSYDPVVAIDLDGTFFLGGVYRNPWEMIIAKSTDFGVTWSSTVVPKPSPTVYEDKPHMIVDVNSGSPYEDYVYLSYMGGLCTTCFGPIMFSRSTDHGTSFSTPISIDGLVTGTIGSIGVNLAIGPGNELYAIWSAFGRWPPVAGDTLQLVFNQSTDGGTTWQGAKSILRLRTLPMNITKAGNCIRAGAGLPSMAVDRSPGTRRGWIYVVYAAESATTPDILLIRSTDGGGSWSSPIKVNQDNSGNDQWLPWISVDPSTGYLYTIYYDSRNFPENDSAEVFISCTTDGGGTFYDMLVSAAPFQPRQAIASAMPCYMGDYIGVSALKDTVWAYWNDNRTGVHQAYARRFPTVGVEEVLRGTPPNFSLEQNYPNPFNPSTTIRYSLPHRSALRLLVFNALGQRVATLVQGEGEAGYHEVRFDATGLSSGVYFYRLSAEQFVQTKKLLLVH